MNSDLQLKQHKLLTLASQLKAGKGLAVASSVIEGLLSFSSLRLFDLNISNKITNPIEVIEPSLTRNNTPTNLKGNLFLLNSTQLISI